MSYKEVFAEVIELRDEQRSIEEFLEEEHPHEMERLREIAKEIPAKLEKLSEAARSHGSNIDFLGHHIKVQKKTKTVIDTVQLLERARERDEIDELIEFGFLELTVNAKQLARLEGEKKAVYGNYIEKKDGTTAVTLPKELKS